MQNSILEVNKIVNNHKRWFETMPIISQSNNGISVILVFSVEQGNQQQLLDAAINNSQNVMEKKPGFVSASFHNSNDGTNMVNYSQWENRKAYDEAINFLTQDEVQIGEKLFDLGEPDWNIYEIIYTEGNNPTTISKNDNVSTIISVYTVEPQAQKKLLDLLKEFSNKIVEKQPGFSSINLHRSYDGKRVLIYSQWKSNDGWESIFTNPEAKQLLDEQNKISKNSWNTYRIAYTTN